MEAALSAAPKHCQILLSLGLHWETKYKELACEHVVKLVRPVQSMTVQFIVVKCTLVWVVAILLLICSMQALMCSILYMLNNIPFWEKSNAGKKKERKR